MHAGSKKVGSSDYLCILAGSSGQIPPEKSIINKTKNYVIKPKIN